MNNVNRTLYIPLYGKAFVSQKHVILQDPKAEEIWKKEGFALKGKAKSKWLAYDMGMRAAVFDGWLSEQKKEMLEACILHIGCGMDSRIERIGADGHAWYDIDFPNVIEERRKYYQESEQYHMISSDARAVEWLEKIPETKAAVVVMEGISMYLQKPELLRLLSALTAHFATVKLLLDCYTVFAAKASKYKNPINEVGVTVLYGIDKPDELEEETKLKFKAEHNLTPKNMVEELEGFERVFFKTMFTGKLTKKIYRLFEYTTGQEK